MRACTRLRDAIAGQHSEGHDLTIAYLLAHSRHCVRAIGCSRFLRTGRTEFRDRTKSVEAIRLSSVRAGRARDCLLIAPMFGESAEDHLAPTRAAWAHRFGVGLGVPRRLSALRSSVATGCASAPNAAPGPGARDAISPPGGRGGVGPETDRVRSDPGMSVVRRSTARLTVACARPAPPAAPSTEQASATSAIRRERQFRANGGQR